MPELALSVDTNDTEAIRAAIKRLGDLLPDQVWVVRLDEKTVELRDLKLGEIELIAEDCNTTIRGVVDFPFMFPRVPGRLVGAVARHLDIEAPALTTRLLNDVFDQVDDDLAALPPDDNEDDTDRPPGGGN